MDTERNVGSGESCCLSVAFRLHQVHIPSKFLLAFPSRYCERTIGGTGR